MEFKTIRESVAYTTGIDEGLIRSLKKKRANGSVVMGTQIMTAKQIAVGLAKKYYPDYTWEEIGWIIGTNDHASVIHHHNKFLDFMETDTDFIKAVFFSEQEYLMRIKNKHNLIHKIPDLLKLVDEIRAILIIHQNKAI